MSTYSGDLFTRTHVWRIVNWNALRLRRSCKWCGARYTHAIARQECPGC